MNGSIFTGRHGMLRGIISYRIGWLQMEYVFMLKKLWLYAERERWKIVVYYFLHIISILGELGQPFAFAMVINTLQKNSDSMIKEVVSWLLIYILCFFVFEVFHRSARFIERFVAFRCRKRFITSMYDHLQSLPLEWHSDNHSGAVIDRVNKAGNAINYFGESQSTYVSVFMKFWGPLIILWAISPVISIVTVISGLIVVVVTRKLYSLSVPEYRSQNDKLHKVATALHDYVSNIRTIIMLRLGKFAKMDIDSRLNRVLPHIAKENVITQIKCFITSLIVVSLDVGLIFYYIASQNQAGAVILIGSVTAIFQYSRQCMSSFQFYTGDYESVIHWKTDFEAVKPILDAKENLHVKEETQISKWNEINVQKLSYSYGEGNGSGQLKEVSLSLLRNRKIAFVGESGAGKSTMLNILRGLIPIKEGLLSVDGKDDFPISALANTTTLIPQEPEIFENSIRYNITMGMPTTEEEIESAIQIAGFSEIVERLPQGLESDVREKGVNLSGGEKQRLALARGIFSIRDSSIILLDEPTASVDPATEMAIFRRLLDHLSDRCVISVMHRLHLVKHFDYVYVFNKGKIVEEGTFDELCAANGEFNRLWNKYQAEETDDITLVP
jgi:ATP-binding cassette, subfamily B, bacterial